MDFTAFHNEWVESELFAEDFRYRQIQIREIFPFVVQHWQKLFPELRVSGRFAVNLVEGRYKFLPPHGRWGGRYLVILRNSRVAVLDRHRNEAHLSGLREYSVSVPPRLPLKLEIVQDNEHVSDSE
jgi:hypothetical protein